MMNPLQQAAFDAAVADARAALARGDFDRAQAQLERASFREPCALPHDAASRWSACTGRAGNMAKLSGQEV